MPETKQYREVKDEGHALDILSNVSDLRNDEHLFDVTLTSGNLRIPCHRIVLAGASKYFRALFTSRMREYGASEIQVRLYWLTTFIVFKTREMRFRLTMLEAENDETKMKMCDRNPYENNNLEGAY